ncbi:uncharacterized protein LOC131027756 [Cryptomeria japonica]|uniref:uncharacterized protein LOC131027756 n=1 Tax=Cryptomeria japonica TaxID=3369 RepID=UPI0025AC909F|nr:uncharacterized protein LOC131027756 [Cryptomeria japonica]
MDLDLHNKDEEEGKPLEHDKIDSSSRERRSTRLRDKTRKEENKKSDSRANVKKLEEIYDFEEDDNSTDKPEDEDFQEEGDNSEENFKEKEGDDISENEEHLDTPEQSPRRPLIFQEMRRWSLIPKTPLLKKITTIC